MSIEHRISIRERLTALETKVALGRPRCPSCDRAIFGIDRAEEGGPAHCIH